MQAYNSESVVAEVDGELRSNVFPFLTIIIIIVNSMELYGGSVSAKTFWHITLEIVRVCLCLYQAVKAINEMWNLYLFRCTSRNLSIFREWSNFAWPLKSISSEIISANQLDGNSNRNSNNSQNSAEMHVQRCLEWSRAWYNRQMHTMND